MSASLHQVAPVSGGFHTAGQGTPPLAPVPRRPLDAETAALLVACCPDLLRQARRLVSSGHDAQDLMQDTFERALRAFHQFRPGSNLRAWLYTILVRRAHDHYRRAKVRRGERQGLEAVLSSPEPERCDGGCWSQVTDVQFQDAIQRLSPRLRSVFELHEMHHLPYQDVAARLGIPINTVGTRLRRARERLRQLLVEETGAGIES